MIDKLKRKFPWFKIEKIVKYVLVYLLISAPVVLLIGFYGRIEGESILKSGIKHYYNLEASSIWSVIGYIIAMVANLVLAGWIAYRIIWSETVLDMQEKLYLSLKDEKLNLKFRVLNKHWKQSDLVDVTIRVTLYNVEDNILYREKWTHKKEKECIHVSTAFSYEIEEDKESDVIKFIKNSLNGNHEENRDWLFVVTLNGTSTQNGQIHSLRREFYSRDLLFGKYKVFYNYEKINGRYCVEKVNIKEFNESEVMKNQEKRKLAECIEKLKRKEPVVIADKINVNFNNEKDNDEKNNYALKIRIGNEDWKTHCIVGAKMKLELFCVKHNQIYERIWEHRLERELICQSATFKYSAEENMNEDLKTFLKNAFLKNVRNRRVDDHDFLMVFSMMGFKTDNKNGIPIGIRKEYYIEDFHFGGYDVFYNYKKEKGRYAVKKFDIKDINEYIPFTEKEKLIMEKLIMEKLIMEKN